MKQSSLLPALLATALLLVATHASADVVVMKDGKKYEDVSNLVEAGDSVSFDYVINGKIKDHRTEKKADIGQVIKVRPEEIAMVSLRKLVPSADLLTADKYEGMIQDQLRPFIAKYPGTAEAKEAEAIIATLNAEKEKVVSGQVKMDGQWLEPEVAKRNAHDIDAYRVRREMNAAAARSDWREALKAWDKLIDRDSGYLDTDQYVKAVPEITKVLESYKKELDAMATTQPMLQQRRDSSLKALQEPDLSRTRRAIDAEIAQHKAENDAEKTAHVRWMTPYKYDIKSIQDAQKAIADETKKLNALDLGRISSAVAAISDARAKLAEKDVEGATAALVNASSAATGLRDSSISSVISKLKTQVSQLKIELGKKKAAQKSFNKVTALTKPGSADATTPPATTDKKDDAATDEKKGDAKTDKKDDDAKAGKDDAKGKKSTTKKPIVHHSSATTEDKDEGMSFSTMLAMGGGGLLIVLLVVMFLQKKKG
jgi:hypothetical protein